MMMSEQRLGPTRSSQIQDGALNASPDLEILVNSESPHIQEIRLYRELNREIERSSADRLRYVDSELYLKAKDRSPLASGSSEVQSTTVNIGTSPQPSGGYREKVFSADIDQKPNSVGNMSRRNDQDAMESSLSNNSASRRERAPNSGANCQVCLIRGLKDDLTNMTKAIKERNEKITSKLKARRMRSFFERQVLD